MTDFQNKTVIVTGATRGIGKAIATAFMHAGAKVIGTYRNNNDAAQALLEEYSKETLELHSFDIGEYDEVEAFYKNLDERDIKIDVLINNGGIRRDSVMAMMKQDDWHQVINTNLNGAYHMSKFAVMNMMRQRYGRIINMSSPMSREAFAGQSNYSASKGGLESMTRSLAKEVASRGITVNCVSPGFIETELIKDLNEATVKEYKKMVPMKRFGQPEEVANAVMFLAGDQSAYVTGSVLEISGGL
jgi:3-oxoacyl-[acyl-carrier protein] reductase